VNDNDVSTTQMNDVDATYVTTTQNDDFDVGHNDANHEEWQIGETESDLNVRKIILISFKAGHNLSLIGQGGKYLSKQLNVFVNLFRMLCASTKLSKLTSTISHG